MSVREYIGARYVPLFADPIEWDNTTTYEPLTIVTYGGDSYTSRQYVPTGIDISNESYWALTGNYNAQIEQYRSEVATFDDRITENETNISLLQSGKIEVFDTAANMAASENDWDYAIVTEGKSVEYCNVDREIIFQRISSDNANYGYDKLITLSDGTKALPVTVFDDIQCNPDTHLACIAPIITNSSYEYLSGYSVFTDPFYDGVAVGACSTLAYMYETGLSLENSRYTLGETASNHFPPSSVKNPDGTYESTTKTFYNGFLPTVEAAYSAILNGYGFHPNYIEDLKVGDVLYTHGSSATIEDELYEIDHCEIVTSVNLDTKTYTVWEWGGVSPTAEAHRSTNDITYPGWSIKEFSSTKPYIGLAARYPIRSDSNPILLYKNTTQQTVNITTQTYATTRKLGVVARCAATSDDCGMIKITIDSEITTSRIKYMIYASDHSTCFTPYFSGSSYCYGGKVVFYAPFNASNGFRICAESVNGTDMDVVINSVTIEGFLMSEKFSSPLPPIRTASSIPGLTGLSTEYSLIPQNGQTQEMLKISNIDWANVSTSSNILIFAYDKDDWLGNDGTLIPLAMNGELFYKASNTWGIKEALDEGEDLIVSVDLPLHIGFFYVP